MLFTLIAMQGVWFAWREYQQRKIVRKRLLLTGTSLSGNGHTVNPLPPFWPAVLARYRKEITTSRHRRVRTHRAIERINTAAQRKLRTGARRG
jgi:hypothetical protein